MTQNVGGETSPLLGTQNADAVAWTGGTVGGAITLTNQTLAGITFTDPVISGGTINNTPIGATTAAAITGTTVVGSTSVASAGPITSKTATAPGAGSALSVGLTTSTTTNLGIFFGTGAPSFAAGQGSIYSNTTATTTTTRVYINQDGSTTWTALTAAA